MQSLHTGQLHLLDEGDHQTFGDATAALRATITVHRPEFYRRVVAGGSLGAAESYIDGDWSTDDLTTLLRLFIRNMDVADEMDTGLARLAGWIARAWHNRRANTRRGSRRNVAAHYDLGNEFFRLFLDERMMYSSAIFEDPGMSLEQASVAKLERICRKLQLSPKHHVLEIGTGWGGFAEYAARNFGCRVTTTTISREQYEFATRRIREAGLDDRVTVLSEDYRDLSGRYDRLVSIEMIEAVGRKFLGTFFQKCGDLITDDGMMLIQGITMPEQRYAQYLKSADFIQRFVFPGSCLTSVSSLGDAAARQTDMRVLHLEELSPHYAKTLNCWRDRFFSRIDDVRAQGFGEPFIRLWDYYLCYCEAGFEERSAGLVQMVFAKPRCPADPVATC